VSTIVPLSTRLIVIWWRGKLQPSGELFVYHLAVSHIQNEEAALRRSELIDNPEAACPVAMQPRELFCQGLSCPRELRKVYQCLFDLAFYFRRECPYGVSRF
jgi:hypothetical protein